VKSSQGQNHREDFSDIKRNPKEKIQFIRLVDLKNGKEGED
jgi:hypothetical protein